MKKILFYVLFAVGVMNVMTAEAAKQNARIQIGPIGEVVYADGTAVSDNEYWVVIYTADDYSFAGFTTNAQGIATLADTAHSVVVSCTTDNYIRTVNGFQKILGTKAQVTSAYLTPTGSSDGIMELYLLDTRDETEESGFSTKDTTTKLPKKINAWAKAKDSNSLRVSDFKYNADTSSDSGSITTTEKTVIDNFLISPVPYIVSLVYGNATSTVGVTNTYASVSYVLKKATDVGFTNVIWTSSSVSGAATPATALEFSDTDATESAAFYRVEVAK